MEGDGGVARLSEKLLKDFAVPKSQIPIISAALPTGA